MRRVALACAVLALAVLVATFAAQQGRSGQRASSWAQVATRACEHMQQRIGFYGWKHWKPLADNRPLARVAVLRQELLVIHEDGLREIRSRAPASTPAQARAVARYSEMLRAIRSVIRTARRGEVRAYNDANVRMVRAIVATRTAFTRAGAGNICNFAI